MPAAARATGGWRGMNRAQRQIALGAATGFLVIMALVMIANAESAISDLAAAGAHMPHRLVWSWEWTSILAWLSVCPLLWWAVAKLRSARARWPVIALAAAVGSVVASGWHIAVMVALRSGYYAATGAGPYRFFGVIGDRLLYEYRKDVTTYLQFVAIAAVVQWLISRAGEHGLAGAHILPGSDRRMLAVSDGAVRHIVPIDEIERVAAAGNYVEITWGLRTLLHRATLAATETELGAEFVRIHRSQLVRRDAIRQVAGDRSGDFAVTLASGVEVRGSRRFRDAVG